MRRLTVFLILALLGATVWSFAVARECGWWFPPNVAVFGDRIDAIFGVLLWIVGAFLVLTLGLLAWTVWRGGRAGPALHTHGDRRLELVWTLVPAGFLVFIAVDQLDEWAELKHAGHRPAVPVHARVVGTQFDWHFVYPGADGRFGTLDDLDAPYELVVPAGEPVVLELVSRDVIHSFFVPALRLKQDVVPGMRPEVWFEARTEGEYDLVCAELCGWGHYKMAGLVRVVSRPEFAAELGRLARDLRANGQEDR